MAQYKYEGIAETIKDKILSGAYKPGSKLPSIQGLAKELSLNADTVIRAYTLLETQNLIYSVAKSGYYVIKSTGGVQQASSVIDMLTTNPSIEINPYKDFYHCMEKAISLYDNKLSAYSPPKGMPELIGLLKKHMTNYQIFTREPDIFITTGAQQALFILAAIKFPNGGNTILVEQPTYNAMLNIIDVSGTPVIGIKRTENGLDLAELERIFAQNRIKFFYTMPRFQNPTGFSYTNAHKKDILALAKKYNVYIVEDDYLADLDTNPKNDPFAALDTDNIVVYVKSFSKTIIPGLNLGMAIVPEPLHASFLKMKHSIDLTSCVFAQGALEIYLRSSMYKTHVRRTKKFYSDRMELLSAECRKELTGITDFFIPPTGIFAHIVAANFSQTTILSKLEKDGLQAAGVDSSYLAGFPHSTAIMLCTCNADSASIPRAVQIIKATLQGR